MLVTQQKYAEAVCKAIGLDYKKVAVCNVQHVAGCSAKIEAGIEITICITPEIMSQIAANLEQ